MKVHFWLPIFNFFPKPVELLADEYKKKKTTLTDLPSTTFVFCALSQIAKERKTIRKYIFKFGQLLNKSQALIGGQDMNVFTYDTYLNILKCVCNPIKGHYFFSNFRTKYFALHIVVKLLVSVQDYVVWSVNIHVTHHHFTICFIVLD